MKSFCLPPLTEIVCSASPGERRAAELRNGQVWGLHWHWPDAPDPTGAVLAVRVRRLAPEAKGAFVAVDDQGTEGFLDLGGERAKPHEGERLLAQVTRAAADGKRLALKPGARLVGRYLVYSPSRPGLAASRGLADKDAARRLQGALRTAVRQDEGVVVRAAAAIHADDPGPLLTELERHRQAWRTAEAFAGLGEALPAPSLWERLLIERTGAGPLCLTADTPRLQAALRQAAAWPQREQIEVSLDTRNPFASSGGEEAMDQALQADLPLPRGGRLWVERTHACWTVDVDTAGTTGSASDLRRMINHAAAVETARQVRLRRAAGSVVVDFLRMERRDHAQEVIADLRAAFAEDHADLQFNDRLDRLGFYAFSRQRLGLELANRIADGGLRAAVLAGLRMLTRETLAQPGRPQALALSPQGAHLLTAMPVALAEASNMLGTPPVIQTDVSLAHAAFALRPIQ